MAAIRYTGSVVYIFAFDIAYDMKRTAFPNVLGQKAEEYLIGPSKRSPRQLFFYRPRRVRTANLLVKTPAGNVEISRIVKIFGVGALSIQIRMPFTVDSLAQLVEYHDMQIDGGSLEKHATALAGQIVEELRESLIKPVEQLEPAEVYTIFCIDKLPDNQKAADWLNNNRRQIAALLTQEHDAAALSEQETMESTSNYLSYYEYDLVVSDWDAAVVVGQQNDIDDTLHIMELANVQLAELRTYDRLLDNSLEQAYRDMAHSGFISRRDVHRSLREIRVDMARLSDELLNATKFFGDWHLARIYGTLSQRFHLSDWFKIVEEKLKTLAELYEILQQQSVNFSMVMLETTIVLLFIIDLVILVMGLKH